MTRAADAKPAFTIFIDGECPLCRHEASLLRRLDRGRRNLELIDITDSRFDASEYGRSFDDFMGEIHGLRSDGSLVTGMEVFRRSYAAVGLGWLLAPTGWPLLRPVCDAAYRWFARRRLKLTGRADACVADRCAPGAAPRA